MHKTALATFLVSLAGLALAPAAFAHSWVVVDGYTYWPYHHAHHLVATQHSHVYYDGGYAYVARDNGATIVNAYPGVSVFVGPYGGVSVHIGY